MSQGHGNETWPSLTEPISQHPQLTQLTQTVQTETVLIGKVKSRGQVLHNTPWKMTTRLIGKKVWWLDRKKTFTKESKSIVHFNQDPGLIVCLVWNSLISNLWPFSCVQLFIFIVFFIVMSPCLFLYCMMKASTAWLKHCNNLLLHAVWSPVNHSAIVYTTASCSSNNSWTNCPLLQLTAYIIASVRTLTCKVSCLMWSFFLMSLYLIPGHRYVQLL